MSCSSGNNGDFFFHDGSGAAPPTQIEQLRVRLQEDDFMISPQTVKLYFSPEIKNALVAMSQNENITSRSKVYNIFVTIIVIIIVIIIYYYYVLFSLLVINEKNIKFLLVFYC